MNNRDIFSNSKIIKFPNTHRNSKQNFRLKILLLLNTIWYYLFLIFNKQNELQVRQQTDCCGNLWWNVYDPVTGKDKKFWSVAEMLAWIEKYYLEAN